MYKSYMYSKDIKCTVGCLSNIINSNLNTMRDSACARMSSADIEALRQCGNEWERLSPIGVIIDSATGAARWGPGAFRGFQRPL